MRRGDIAYGFVYGGAALGVGVSVWLNALIARAPECKPPPPAPVVALGVAPYATCHVYVTSSSFDHRPTHFIECTGQDMSHLFGPPLYTLRLAATFEPAPPLPVH